MKWSENEVEVLKEEYPENGAEIPELDRTDQAIMAKAERIGLYSYEARRNEVSDEKLKQLRDEGLTYQEIADKVNVSKSHVYSRFKSFDKESRLKPSSITQMSDTEKAYVAGIIDGEGCIGLWTSKLERDGWTRERIVPSVVVEMTSEETVSHIAKVIGNKSYNEYPPTNGNKRNYKISVQAQNEVKELLKQIKPFLVEKDKQAEKVINYCEGREAHKPYTEEEFEMVEDLKDMRL